MEVQVGEERVGHGAYVKVPWTKIYQSVEGSGYPISSSKDYKKVEPRDAHIETYNQTFKRQKENFESNKTKAPHHILESPIRLSVDFSTETL